MKLLDTALDLVVGAAEVALRAEPLRRARPRRGERRWWALAACGAALMTLSASAATVLVAAGPSTG